MTPQSLPWIDPLTLASAVTDSCFVLLYSGVQTDTSGRYSYLARGLSQRMDVQDFGQIETIVNSHPYNSLADRWFTLLTYGLKNTLETLPDDDACWFALPPACMLRFSQVYEFDHQYKTLTMWGEGAPLIANGNIPTGGYKCPSVERFGSLMSDSEYLEKAALIIEHIHKGELYQANLTRKYQGSFAQAPDYFSLFMKLCEISPAAYSSYVRLEDQHILSSSPELFLKCTPSGYIQSRPIKGTAPRSTDKLTDSSYRQALYESPKDRAENLMIVDLMRNDLARSCLAGSIEVERLFDITSHATVHHMSSTVSGQIHPDSSHVKAIQACFPPGSMTGAPKIHAMSLCSELEKLERGIYSGAIGWMDAKGGAELSVVIRTLLMEGKKFEFQVGGGIVADSTPEGELQEILIKANGIAKSLGFDDTASLLSSIAPSA